MLLLGRSIGDLAAKQEAAPALDEELGLLREPLKLPQAPRREGT